MAVSERISGSHTVGRFRYSGIRQREIKRFFTALLYLLPSLILFSAFTFIPLIRTIGLSTYLTNPLGIAVKFVGLAQYEKLFDTPVFVNSIQRSLLFVAYTVPTSVLVSLGLALLGNMRLKGISFFRGVFSVTIAVSAATASLIFKYLYHPALGSLNYVLTVLGFNAVPWLTSEKTALIAVSLGTVWLQIGLNTVILLAAMQGINDELYESAMIDGANYWHKFKSITIPMLSPTFFFLIMLLLTVFQFGVLEKRVFYD